MAQKVAAFLDGKRGGSLPSIRSRPATQQSRIDKPLNALLARQEGSLEQQDVPKPSRSDPRAVQRLREDCTSRQIQLSHAWTKWDRDGSGSIDKSEFVLFIRSFFGKLAYQKDDIGAFFDELNAGRNTRAVTLRQFKIQLVGRAADSRPKSMEANAQKSVGNKEVEKRVQPDELRTQVVIRLRRQCPETVM